MASSHEAEASPFPSPGPESRFCQKTAFCARNCLRGWYVWPFFSPRSQPRGAGPLKQLALCPHPGLESVHTSTNRWQCCCHKSDHQRVEQGYWPGLLCGSRALSEMVLSSLPKGLDANLPYLPSPPRPSATTEPPAHSENVPPRRSAACGF